MGRVSYAKLEGLGLLPASGPAAALALSLAALFIGANNAYPAWKLWRIDKAKKNEPFCSAASPWGWIALGAVVISAIGYATQTILDYVPDPAIVGALVFYGLFAGFALVTLFSGVIAVATGWKRTDHTLRFGLIGIGYVALAQTIQSLWD